MKVIGILVFFLCLVSIPSVYAFIYPQREVVMPTPLLGERFTLCNGQVFMFPFARIALRRVPGRDGGEGIHLLHLTELEEAVLYCNGKPCGITLKETPLGEQRIVEGIQLSIIDSVNSLQYIFMVVGEEVGWIEIQLTAVYGIPNSS